MRLKLGYRGVGSLAAALCALAVVAAEPPETITLDACGEKQPAVEFSHAEHAGLTGCATCHHTQPDLTAGSGTAEPCSGCHVTPEDPATPGCSDMSLSKNIYHKNCIDCHKAEAKQDSSIKAPTKCAECHPKS